MPADTPPPEPPLGDPSTEPADAPATEAEWAALTFAPLVADREAFLAGLGRTLQGVSLTLLAAAPCLADDDVALAGRVAAEPDAFLELAAGLGPCRERLTHLSDLARACELRLLAAHARWERDAGEGDAP